MDIETIRELLSISISENEEWANVLNDTEPGHYGVIDWEVELYSKDIWVNIQERTFTFKDANFNFTVQLGSSNEDDGFKMPCFRVASGEGTFEFTNSNNSIKVSNIEIKVDLDLMAE